MPKAGSGLWDVTANHCVGVHTYIHTLRRGTISNGSSTVNRNAAL